MAKAILTVGYAEYVLDVKDALAITEILGKAERHESKYHGNGNSRTYHIYEDETADFGSLRLISDGFYRMAKLAGKPEKS